VFPSGSHPYTDHYDYLSDSDLEDEEPLKGERDSQERLEGASKPETSQTIVSDLPSPVETSEASNSRRSTPLTSDCPPVYTDHRSNDNLTRMGKVAIIRDMGAVTCVLRFSTTDSPILLFGCRFEALLYFLYTGEINFARLSSDPCHNLTAQARTGDWSIGKLPSPSAKSIYRLADKVTSPTSCVWCPFDLSGLVRYTDPQGASQGVHPQQPGTL